MVTPLVSMENAGRLFQDPDLAEELQLAFARDTLFAESTPTAIVKEFIDNLGYFREASTARSGANRATLLSSGGPGARHPC